MGMRIQLGTEVLADPVLDNVSGYALNGSRAVQVDELLRARSVRIRGRGNMRTSIEFVVTREHATVAAARAAQLAQAVRLADIADGTLITELAAETTVRLEVPTASLVEYACQLLGRSTRTTCKLIGGALIAPSTL